MKARQKIPQIMRFEAELIYIDKDNVQKIVVKVPEEAKYQRFIIPLLNVVNISRYPDYKKVTWFHHVRSGKTAKILLLPYKYVALSSSKIKYVEVIEGHLEGYERIDVKRGDEIYLADGPMDTAMIISLHKRGMNI